MTVVLSPKLELEGVSKIHCLGVGELNSLETVTSLSCKLPTHSGVC